MGLPPSEARSVGVGSGRVPTAAQRRRAAELEASEVNLLIVGKFQVRESLKESHRTDSNHLSAHPLTKAAVGTQAKRRMATVMAVQVELIGISPTLLIQIG